MVVSLSIIGAPGEASLSLRWTRADADRPTPGLIGQRHTQHALDEPNVNLTCIVDPTPAGPPYAEKLGVKLYRSTEDMLAARTKGEVRVDAAILAVRPALTSLTSWATRSSPTPLRQTPNATHVPLGIQLVQAGIHTLVEKPFSTDVESGRALLAAEASSSAKILVGHHRRFVGLARLCLSAVVGGTNARTPLTFATCQNPYVVNTKKLLDNGKLGNGKCIPGGSRLSGADEMGPVLAVQGTWACLKVRRHFSRRFTSPAECARHSPCPTLPRQQNGAGRKEQAEFS